MPIVDTNVFIRLLTNDNAELSPRAAAFFKDVEDGLRTIQVPEAVVAEIVYVLGSPNLYGHSRQSINEEVGYLIRLPGIEIPNKQIMLEALSLYVDYPRLAFIDALCIAHAQRFDDATVITFDRGYPDVEGLTRVEP